MKNLRIYFSFNELSQSSLEDLKNQLKYYNSNLYFFKHNVSYSKHVKLRPILFGKIYYLESVVTNLEQLNTLLAVITKFLALNKYIYLMLCVYKGIICHVEDLIVYLRKVQIEPFHYNQRYVLSFSYINYQIIISFLKKYILMLFVNFKCTYIYYLKNYKLY